MTIFSYNDIFPAQADFLLANQKLMDAGQRMMCQESRHLIWVTEPSRNLSPKLRQAVWDSGDAQCDYCGIELTQENFTVDHIHPVAMGGGDDIENLTVACRPCNSSKGDRLL